MWWGNATARVMGMKVPPLALLLEQLLLELLLALGVADDEGEELSSSADAAPVTPLACFASATPPAEDAFACEKEGAAYMYQWRGKTTC